MVLMKELLFLLEDFYESRAIELRHDVRIKIDKEISPQVGWLIIFICILVELGLHHFLQ